MITESVIFQLVTTLIVYIFYGILLGLCLVPPMLLLITVWQTLGGIFPGGLFSPAHTVLIALTAGISVFVFFITGVLFLGSVIRLLSFGVKPGSYSVSSPTMLRWLIYSGIYTMVNTLILPVIPMTLFSQLFFRLMGCRIGRNVQINTGMLNDCYLLTIEDDVVVGGQTDISCHTFENGRLILKPVHIGKGCLIGAHCYIAPGVSIGEKSVIGLYSYIRQDRVLPPGSRLTSVAAVDFSTAGSIERGRLSGILNRKNR